MSHNDNLIYAILKDGTIVLGEHRMFAHPSADGDVAGVRFGHGSVAIVTQAYAMAFPATRENYQALKVLYADIPVPKLPPKPSPNDIVSALLKRQKLVIIKSSPISYDDARGLPRMFITKKESTGNYFVPYDLNGNEITTIEQEQ